MIHLRGASFVYQAPDGEVEALRRVDIDIAPGEFCSVVAPPSAVPPGRSGSCPSGISCFPGALSGTT